MANLFPTCVGMNRRRARLEKQHRAVPHVRGDEPPIKYLALDEVDCSPRAWG